MRRIIIPLGVLLTSAVLAAPLPAKDPWTKVPKLPTACYSGQDRYFEEADAAVESIQQDLYRQDEVNDALIAKLDAIDGMEKQSRMQTFLMENPQEAMEYMKAVQETGSGIAGEVNKEAENEQKFLDELKGIQAKYEAAIDKAQGPLWASLKALGISEMGTPQKTIDAGMVIMKKINAEYERVCHRLVGRCGAVPRLAQAVQGASDPGSSEIHRQERGVQGVAAQDVRRPWSRHLRADHDDGCGDPAHQAEPGHLC